MRGQPNGEFAVDERLTQSLDERGGITTIAALRRAVAERTRRTRPATASAAAAKPARRSK